MTTFFEMKPFEIKHYFLLFLFLKFQNYFNGFSDENKMN